MFTLTASTSDTDPASSRNILYPSIEQPPSLTGGYQDIEICDEETEVIEGRYKLEGDVQGLRETIFEGGPSPLKLIAVR